MQIGSENAQSSSLIVRWRVIGGSKLYFHSWESETAVFNPLSGNTHVLESIAAEILMTLQHEPLDLKCLARAISVKQKWDFNLVLDKTEAALTEMLALLLVERI